MNRKIFVGGVLLPLIMAIRSSGDVDTSQEKYSSAAYPQSLLDEGDDMRYDFYESGYDGVEKYKKKGLFLMIGQFYKDAKGFSFSHAIGISTNECPTVGSAIAKYSGPRDSQQIRLIQMNAILQTRHTALDAGESRKAMLAMKLQAGDILILSAMK